MEFIICIREQRIKEKEPVFFFVASQELNSSRDCVKDPRAFQTDLRTFLLAAGCI